MQSMSGSTDFLMYVRVRLGKESYMQLCVLHERGPGMLKYTDLGVGQK